MEASGCICITVHHTVCLIVYVLSCASDRFTPQACGQRSPRPEVSRERSVVEEDVGIAELVVEPLFHPVHAPQHALAVLLPAQPTQLSGWDREHSLVDCCSGSLPPSQGFAAILRTLAPQRAVLAGCCCRSEGAALAKLHLQLTLMGISTVQPGSHAALMQVVTGEHPIKAAMRDVMVPAECPKSVQTLIVDCCLGGIS